MSHPTTAGPAPAPPQLSFAENLRHAFTPLTDRMNHGTAILDEVISMFRDRIKAESEYTNSLEKLCQRDILQNEVGTIRMALQALKADMSNEYTARSEFVTSLDEEVYQPLVQFRQKFSDANREFIVQTKQAVKQLRVERTKWMKVKTRFDRVERDAQVAKQALMDAQNPSSSQVVKLGTRVNTTMKTQQQWLEKYTKQKTLWGTEQQKFFETMTSILHRMQNNEADRLKCLCDISRKCAVFITNLTANRSYDIRGIANVMDQTNPVQDVQELIQQLLRENPPKTPSKSVSVPTTGANNRRRSKTNYVHTVEKNSDDEGSRLSREGSTSRLQAFFGRNDEDSLSLPRYSLSTSEAVSTAFTIASPPPEELGLPESTTAIFRTSSKNSEDDPEIPALDINGTRSRESPPPPQASDAPPDIVLLNGTRSGSRVSGSRSASRSVSRDKEEMNGQGEESRSNTGSSFLHASKMRHDSVSSRGDDTSHRDDSNLYTSTDDAGDDLP